MYRFDKYQFDKFKKSLNDGMFELDRVGAEFTADKQDSYPPLWPEYIESIEHPFTFCHSLSISVDGNISKNFSNSDGYETFKRNLTIQGENWHYRNKEIDYKVNKSGYRTREWNDIDWKESIVILGCSCTFGVGLAEDETISYNIEKLTGRPAINLGYPSGSNPLIIQNLATLIHKFPNPYAVVINWSTIDRMRYFTKFGYVDLGPWDQNNNNNASDGVRLSDLYKNHFLNEYNNIGTTYFLGLIAKGLVKDKSKYVNLSYFPDAAYYARAERHFVIDNQARDCIHPGRNNAKEVSEYVVSRLNQ